MNTIEALESIFADVLALRPPERPAFLDNACHGERGLREQIEKMLAAHDKAGCFLESPPAVLAVEELPTIGQRKLGAPTLSWNWSAVCL